MKIEEIDCALGDTHHDSRTVIINTVLHAAARRTTDTFWRDQLYVGTADIQDLYRRAKRYQCPDNIIAVLNNLLAYNDADENDTAFLLEALSGLETVL